MDINWKNSTLGINESIFKAVEVLEKGLLQIVLVVDDEEKLLGTITDGDVRRGLLNGISLQESINRPINIIELEGEE